MRPLTITADAVGDRRSRRRGSARSAAPRSRPRPPAPRSASPTCSTITGASPSVGSSITSSFGFEQQRAADREHLLLAARQLRAAVAACARPGAGTSHRRARPRAARPATRRKVSSTDERRPDAPPLRHVGDAAPRDLVAAPGRGSPRRAGGRCRCAGTSPVIALHSVVLPMPLRPTMPSTPRSSVRLTPCSAWARP